MADREDFINKWREIIDKGMSPYVSKDIIKALTGYMDFNNEAVSNFDSRIINLENNETIFQLYEYVGKVETGQVEVPEKGQIYDFYQDGIIDAVVVLADDEDKPIDEVSLTEQGDVVLVDSLDNSGNYTISGRPDKNSCIVYYIKIANKYIEDVPQDKIVAPPTPLDISRITPTNIVSVARSGGDVDSIYDACLLIQTSDPSPTNQWTIMVYPGTYVEPNFILPNNTTLIGVGGANTVTIVAQTVSGDFITVRQACAIVGVAIVNKTAGVALRLLSDANNCVVRKTAIVDCQTGFLVGYDNNNLKVRDITFNSANGTRIGVGFNVTRGTIDVDGVNVINGTEVFKLFSISSTGTGTFAKVRNVDSKSPLLDYVFDISGTGTKVNMYDISCVQAYHALHMRDGVSVIADNFKAYFGRNDAVKFQAGDGQTASVNITSSVFSSAVGLDMNIEGSNIEMTGNCQINRYNSFFNQDAIIVLQIASLFKGDEGMINIGQFQAGTPERPAESIFGSGDSYSGVGAVHYYMRNGDNNQFTDVTEIGSNVDGQTIPWPNVNVNTALYIASNFQHEGDYLKVPGLKLKVNETTDNVPDVIVADGGVPTSNVGGNFLKDGRFNGKDSYYREDNAIYLFYLQGYWCLDDKAPGVSSNYFNTRYAKTGLTGIEGDYMYMSGAVEGTPTVTINTQVSPFIVEYFDADSNDWEPVTRMLRDSKAPFDSNGLQVFEGRGNFHLFLNILLDSDTPWSKNNEPGISDGDRYWLRVRLTQSVTVAPEIEQVKIHTSRSEKEETGFDFYYGKARFFKPLPWDLGMMEAAASSPANQDLYLTKDIDRGYVENKFNNGAVDRIGYNTILPPETDTSSPIRLRFIGKTDNNSGGQIFWYIRWGYSRDRGALYDTQLAAPLTHPTKREMFVPVDAPLDGEQETFYVDLDISNMIPVRRDGNSDVLWISIERAGNADSHTGDVALVTLSPLYVNVSNGGHI